MKVVSAILKEWLSWGKASWINPKNCSIFFLVGGKEVIDKGCSIFQVAERV